MNFKHDKIQPFPKSKVEKKIQVATMFNSIAPNYDLLNSVLSLRIHKLWRKQLIKTLKTNEPQKILDIATGTGELAINIKKHLPQAQITGIDISTAMLQVAQQKIDKLGIEIKLLQGDGENLPFQSSEFDAICIGFGVRNFQNLKQGLEQCHQVLTDKGLLLILEFSQPNKPIVKQLYKWYSKIGIPLLGRLCAGNQGAYEYLQKSANAFPSGKDFVKIVENAGFKNVTLKELSFGICTLYQAYKN